jgi:hypothetical protein
MTALMSMVGASEYTAKMEHRSIKNWKAKRELAVKTGKVMSANVGEWIDTIVDEKSQTGRTLKSHFVLNPEKSVIVRNICDLFLNGMGCQSIARKCNIEKVQTLRNGKYWGPPNVRAVLRNPALCGRYVHTPKKKDDGSQDDATIIESYYPPLISRKVFDEIQLLLKSANKSKLRPDPTLANPLAGLCNCSQCDSLMTRVSQKAYRGRKAYEKLVCISAKSGLHKYRSIEVDHVMGHLFMLFQFPASFNPQEHDALTPLQAKLADIDRRLENTTKAIATVGLSEALQRSLKGLEAERAAVVALIDEEAAKAVYGDAKRMSELTVEAKRAMTSRNTDAATVNGLLRRIFKNIKIDLENSEVWCEWQSGKVSVLTI